MAVFDQEKQEMEKRLDELEALNNDQKKIITNLKVERADLDAKLEDLKSKGGAAPGPDPAAQKREADLLAKLSAA